MFILGTDTDVGKTAIASALVTAWLTEGPVRYWKPVQAGLDETDQDAVDSNCPGVALEPNLYAYKEPASPDQSLQAATHPIEVAKLVREWQELALVPSRLVVEGAGGLMVPLNHRGETWLDVLERMAGESPQPPPILLVARSGLGTLNHTILTVEALKSRGLMPQAVVLNGPHHAGNRTSLARRYKKLPLIDFPTLAGPQPLRLRRGFRDASKDLALRLGEALSLRAHSSQNVSKAAREQRERCCWHPYTQHQTAPLPKLVERSYGGFYYNREEEGPHKVYDGLGSWWVNTVGHGRSSIATAVAKQLRRNDHSIFAAASHEPALQLAERITAKLGHGLKRVFFTENGSCAVEVGLKMAYQGFSNRGESGRRTFVALKGSYHGDTFGTMAVGGMPGFHGMFAPFLFDVHHIAPVTTHPCGVCPQPDLARAQRELDELFASRAETMAGVLVEPFVQGAGGMVFQHPEFLHHLGTLAKSHGIPLIFDEVFTGMGRLGTPFAFHKLGISPDIICLAKGITGGTLPLALTVATEDIFSRFLSDDAGKALLHGHSFTANPAGCAAALATLDIYDQEELWQRANDYEPCYREFLAVATEESLIENGRCLGSILAMEIKGSGTGDYFSGAAKAVVESCYKKGLFIRPLGNTLYLAPPLALALSDIEAMTRLLIDALREHKKRP